MISGLYPASTYNTELLQYFRHRPLYLRYSRYIHWIRGEIRVIDPVVDVYKIRTETIKLLRENIARSRLSVRKTMELRSFLFYAAQRGIPLGVKHIKSDFLAGNHGKLKVKPLSECVIELEQAQKELESLHHYIAFCEEELERITTSQNNGDKKRLSLAIS